MKLRILLFFALLLSVKSFSQDMTIKDVKIKMDENMFYVKVPEMKDNITRVIEISKISNFQVNSYRKSVKNCASEGKVLLAAGDYILRVTIIKPKEKNYIEEQKFTIL